MRQRMVNTLLNDYCSADNGLVKMRQPDGDENQIIEDD
jgi:hypothetical protein